MSGEAAVAERAGEPVEHFQAIVVGSGFAGAVTACRLAQAKLDVCVLERGRRYLPSDLPVLPEQGFGRPPQEGAPPGADRALPDFSRAFWQVGQGLWELRDLDELVVGQAAGYGGGSLIYANVHLRASRRAFDAWPACYREGASWKLGPYYDLAAYMLQVQAMPDAPRKTRRFEEAAAGLGRRTFRPPLAVNFDAGAAENPFGVKQGVCDMRAQCLLGCERRAKNTLDFNYLHVAEEAGVAVRTLAEVVALKPREAGGYELEIRDHLARGQAGRLTADYVFLCAGALNTTELLLRNREALGLTSEKLGSGFFPNADDLAIVFDCKDPQELDRGPTITSSLLYDDGKTWLLVQDGGFPTHLEPLLGLYRSPLWLHRNRYAMPAGRDGDAPCQPPPDAELPFESLLDAFSMLTGSAVTTTLPIVHDLSQTFLAFARGGREVESWSAEHAERGREWRVLPEELRDALRTLHRRALDAVALGSEPFVDAFVADTVDLVAKDVERLLERMRSLIGVPDVDPRVFASWALRLAIQNTWGSQAALIGALAQNVGRTALPSAATLHQRFAELLRWALDYRVGNGHTAALLSMGRDTGEPWRLGLERWQPVAGDPVQGRRSGATAVLVQASRNVLVLTGVRGAFEKGEELLVGSRLLATVERGALQDLAIPARGEPADGGDVPPLSLGALRVAPIAAAAGRSRTAPLQARPAEGVSRRDRVIQEGLLRDLAQQLGGELRADPVEAFLDRRVSVHAQGGCPMGADASQGVTADDGGVFGCDGLYVMDGAAFPAPVGANPSATIAAVAEYKVERFVRDVLGREVPEPWRKHRDDAAAWAAPRRALLDPIGELESGWTPSPVPVSRPIGIAFEEVMKGTHRPPGQGRNGPEHPIRTDLAVSVPDLTHFLACNERELAVRLEARGSVTLTGFPDPRAGALECPAEGHLEFSRPPGPGGEETRTIAYRLEFSADGRAFVLEGEKHIRDEARFDVWEDTTTLFFELLEGDRVRRKGILRVPAADFFGRQLPSFRVTGLEGPRDDPARRAWAFASFGRFFFGHLVDVYVPAFQRLVDVTRGIAGKGHV